MGNNENNRNKQKQLSFAYESKNEIKKYNLDMSKRSLSLPVQQTENENIESNDEDSNTNKKLNNEKNEEENNIEKIFGDLNNEDKLAKIYPKFNGIKRSKRISNDLLTKIDKKLYLTNNDIPMMKTANNFYSKKINFDGKEEKIKDNIKKNNEINEENKISSFKNISKKFQINNEDKTINNINENENINEEVQEKENKENKEKKENKENDDLDSNININKIIEDKQDKQENTYLNEETKKKIDKYHEDRKKRKFKRFNSSSDINIYTKTPQKVFLFDNPNLFDLFLIILNHNYYINNYLEKHQKDIEKWDKTNQFFLSGILYYINKYLWRTKPEKIITKDEIRKKYTEFLDCCIQQSCKTQNPQQFLYNINNIELFVGFIFRKINQEITTAKIDRQIQYVHTNNIALDNFKNNFVKNNSSMISAYYIGFFQEETTCICCKNKMQNIGNYYTPIKNYAEFSFISFDLLEIKNQMNLYQSMNSYNYNMNLYQNNNVQYNNNNNLNLIFSLGQELKKNNVSYCNLCFFKTQKFIQKKLLALPKVLTFIINNNDGNFYIDDEIDLSQYCIYQGNYNYYLIAMLCKYTYDNSFIAYCFNQKDGNWYYYTKNEIKVNKAESLDINAIPFLLVYQSVECEEFNYNKINLENANNKKGYQFKFQNSFPDAILYFGINDTVKDVKETIKRLYNFNNVEDIKLVFKGDKLKDEDLICYVEQNNSPIVVIPIMS